MKLYVILFLAASLVTLHFQANAACETVTVSWTPPDLTEMTYTGYRIYYTDSLGTDKIVPVNVDKVVHKIPCVEFGLASFYMTSLAGSAESDPSNVVQKDVVYTGLRHRDWLRLHEMRSR